MSHHGLTGAPRLKGRHGGAYSDPISPRCKTHPREAAGWKCGACGSLLCPDCVAVGAVGSTALTSCAVCGGHQPSPITAHRASVPYARRILSAWKYPLSKSGLFSMIAFGLGVWIASFFWLGRIIWLAFWAYMFFLIRQTAQGKDDIEPPDFSDVWDDLFLPTLKGVLATSMLWLPLLLYILFGASWQLGEPISVILKDPIAWAFLLAGIFYVPMGLLIAATGGSLLQMMNPLLVIGYIFRVGRDYAIAAVVLFVLKISEHVLDVLAHGIFRAFVPWIGEVLAIGASLYVPFVMARVLGMLLYVRGDLLDYGVAEDYRMPVLPGVEPRGKPRAPQPNPSAAPSGSSHRPSVVRSPAAPLVTTARLTAALHAQNFDEALATFRQIPLDLEGEVSASNLIEVGQAAVGKQIYPVAARAFRIAAERSDDPLAPKACVLLARLMAEHLGKQSEANAYYQRVLSRYPGTAAAHFARQRLGLT